MIYKAFVLNQNRRLFACPYLWTLICCMIRTEETIKSKSVDSLNYSLLL